ncbi:MAG: NAD(P)H-dependent oxidoreductase [Oscillospiraceae bacterium]|nr:NAD(P)H-dependent oxidoreductase [Oscillospiraceae bacterium]
MNILVISGSPKGEESITLQTALYLECLHPEHSFRYIHAGRTYRSLERDFSPAARELDRADLLLFVYPVYTFLVPSQLHRFIELLKASGVEVRGKYATQLTTSKHFYDVTAHAFIRENCQDLGLRFINGLSADMEDLLHEKGRREAEAFFGFVTHCISLGLFEAPPAALPPAERKPATPLTSVGAKSGRIAIVADLAPDDDRLAAMIDRFRAASPLDTSLINLREFPFKGGCLSCFHCASDGKCVYTDGFEELLRSRIQTADAIVLAFTIRDHSMGSLFKTYDDRQFCNGHRSVTMGMPFGYIVSGDYSREANLRMVVEARAETGGNFLAGVATDETDPDREIDALAQKLDYAVRNRYVQPANFYGVGGMKIFRDLIWQMQGLMREDHRFYKAHGQYDFPQKRRGTMLAMYLVGAMASNPKLRDKMGGKMTEGMLMPYKSVIKKAKRKSRHIMSGRG